MNEVTDHRIQKAKDETRWINSLAPVIYFNDEIKMRDGYASYFKKKAHLHTDLIAENKEFSQKLQ
jgi:hypothetical protein